MDHQKQPVIRYTKTIQYAKTVTGTQTTEPPEKLENISQDHNDDQESPTTEETIIDQQQQHTTPNTREEVEVQNGEPQQQQDNIQDDRDNKRINPARGNQRSQVRYAQSPHGTLNAPLPSRQILRQTKPRNS